WVSGSSWWPWSSAAGGARPRAFRRPPSTPRCANASGARWKSSTGEAADGGGDVVSSAQWLAIVLIGLPALGVVLCPLVRGGGRGALLPRAPATRLRRPPGRGPRSHSPP